MSHNLAIDSKSGEAALYLLQEPAWHKLGQVVEEAKTSEEVLNCTFLTPEERATLALGDNLSTRRSNFMQEVYNALYSAPGQEYNPGTGLWVLNGVTSFLQNVKSYKTEDRKMSGLMFRGEESLQSQKAFDQLVSMI